MSVKVFGYGSLMSFSSALSTCPSVSDFAPAVLLGYRRRFSLVSISGLRTGGADLDTLEMAALGIEPSHAQPYAQVNGCSFDIAEGDLASYLEREARYELVRVTIDVNGSLHPSVVTVVPFATNEAYITAKFDPASGDPAQRWHERVGQYYTGSLFERTDILPMRGYLRDCLSSALALGGATWLDNFLDQCVCADGVTTMRQYIEKHPDRVSLPPHTLTDRLTN